MGDRVAHYDLLRLVLGHTIKFQRLDTQYCIIKYDNMLSRFDTIPERDRQADRRTDGRT